MSVFGAPPKKRAASDKCSASDVYMDTAFRDTIVPCDRHVMNGWTSTKLGKRFRLCSHHRGLYARMRKNVHSSCMKNADGCDELALEDLRDYNTVDAVAELGRRYIRCASARFAISRMFFSDEFNSGHRYWAEHYSLKYTKCEEKIQMLEKDLTYDEDPLEEPTVQVDELLIDAAESSDDAAETPDDTTIPSDEKIKAFYESVIVNQDWTIDDMFMHTDGNAVLMKHAAMLTSALRGARLEFEAHGSTMESIIFRHYHNHESNSVVRHYNAIMFHDFVKMSDVLSDMSCTIQSNSSMEPEDRVIRIVYELRMKRLISKDATDDDRVQFLIYKYDTHKNVKTIYEGSAASICNEYNQVVQTIQPVRNVKFKDGYANFLYSTLLPETKGVKQTADVVRNYVRRLKINKLRMIVRFDESRTCEYDYEKLVKLYSFENVELTMGVAEQGTPGFFFQDTVKFTTPSSYEQSFECNTLAYYGHDPDRARAENILKNNIGKILILKPMYAVDRVIPLSVVPIPYGVLVIDIVFQFISSVGVDFFVNEWLLKAKSVRILMVTATPLEYIDKIHTALKGTNISLYNEPMIPKSIENREEMRAKLQKVLQSKKRR